MKKNNIIKFQENNKNHNTFGKILFNVRDENVAMPIRDAKVDIFEETSLGETQIESLTTNISGQTETIELNAPPIDYSLKPQNEVRPYSTYNIKVSASDFKPIFINNIEIFNETTAIQDINLSPQRSFEEYERIINITDNTLWGDFPPKIPEDEVKKVPEATGFVVLDKVVVPEFVVVHDGPPTNTNAANYWIPFRDYIKNVASSEIYSTWPEQTIRANVLAILSFTLNRVFTEWYRGQGKDFTITSSTAYDQKFTYGRNIFVEISNIVDEMFTNYITREGIMQPLFTQYCDGKNVTCPNWLSQWGSASLGEAGKNYIDILKNYYGDIYIDKAPIVNGVPLSFPGHVLQLGSDEESVRVIQRQLNAISNNYPNIPVVRVDGLYGMLTEEAVKIFQRQFSMPVTGTVDFATWYKISYVYVAITKIATLI
ncbi:MAG: peptidoglycan-binding protein [Defluviitaleaceae bacterium]|nr:peptidoglycan-binding protein [Defluviitaleaceae bacterium]